VWDFGAPGKEWMTFLLGNEKQNPDSDFSTSSALRMALVTDKNNGAKRD
jgi:hypothetical protein